MGNALQAFNDSVFGVVLGTTLHTLGAIGLLGGLIGYIAWHRHLGKGHHHGNALALATFLTYFAIVINLVGGFMRTYETGHPHLDQFGTSAWVRAIALKHLFLFAGMGAAVFLFEVVAPRHLRAHREQRLEQVSQTGHRLGVLFVVLGIVVAAVLGAVSSVIALPSDDAPDDHDVHSADAFHNATGQLTSTPLTPGTATGTFTVPANSTDLVVALRWTPTVANLVILLEASPGGQDLRIGGGNGAADGALGSAPAPGTWTYTISSSDPVVNAAWQLVLRLPHADPSPA